MASEKPKKRRKIDAIEPVAAFFLIEKLTDKCLELAVMDVDANIQLDQITPMLEVIKKTSKTARYSASVANKQAMARMISLGEGLSMRPCKPKEEDPLP